MGSQRVGHDWVTKYTHTHTELGTLQTGEEEDGEEGERWREQSRQSSVQDSMLPMQEPQV